MSSYQVIDYQDKYQEDFAKLNYAWIEKFFTVEEMDQETLDKPKEKIYGPGGHILLAEKDGEIVGTTALIKLGHDRYELAKMCVDPNHQGHGLGYLLGKATIEKAKAMGAKSLYLETNSKLQPAIALYRKLGFKDSAESASPYCRCDVQMEMDLQ